MKYKISRPQKIINQKILLPSSKSISNRVLLMDALAGRGSDLKNLAESDDTQVMRKALMGKDELKDIGHAGTAMRFLTAYYAVGREDVVLTGSERMQQRPIGILVDALRKLGAHIDYLNRPGYPPLRISGTDLKGGRIAVDGSVSSQFISALLMISPVVSGGLEIELTGKVVSETYIRMTLELMRMYGVEYQWSWRRIYIQEGTYRPANMTVESDWSAASYWYAIAALGDDPGIELPFLFQDSLQGDAIVSQIFEKLLVRSLFEKDHIHVDRVKGSLPGLMELDFTLCPDLVQTLAVVLCALGIRFHFNGTQTLRIKETDRIAALQKELGKFGFILVSDDKGSFLSWEGERCEKEEDPVVETYHDHRMAMAFAPLALRYGSVQIEDPMVVTKSYPDFWEDLKKVGFKVLRIANGE